MKAPTIISERPAREESDLNENLKVATISPDVYKMERNISFIHSSPTKNSIVDGKESQDMGEEEVKVAEDSDEEAMQQ